ncbi:class I SAM-dependent DNA methyltransferase [Variovorax sp. OV700]|uniref:type I restriction-modification system subunit M n=1 Tax=Variovorax sp. OV700 TaxID=1882826 RepID=UPI0008923E67|nr:class I SAM-dependent DNA methyltransferase [Variovorax sp. OV700]SDI01230.1 type I restriction enzyme M protein [Variovorax sp. OV700]
MDYQELKLLEDDLWEAADQLRANSKLTASEYSMPVLGLIFLRHATTRFHALLPDVEKAVPARATGALREDRIKLGFQGKAAIYLPETARYDYLAALPAGTNVGEAIRDAMIAIEDSVTDQKGQKLLEGALPKDYLGLEQDLLAELLKIFNRPALQTATGDVFGRIYEYFLNQFAQSGAQEGGEFFTPPSLVRMIVNVIEPDHGVVLDPACGSAGMFVQTGHFIEEVRHKSTNDVDITFYGQEKADLNSKLARMNLAVHGLEGNIRIGNTFYEDHHQLLGACDFVMANPPFNVDGVQVAKVKNQVCEKQTGRLPFGLPGVATKTKGKNNGDGETISNANSLWLQYFYSYLNDSGRAGFVMASSASDAGNKDKEIRQKLVETGHVDVMMSIGPKFFYTRSLPCALWFFDKGKPDNLRDTVLMIDARNVYTVVSARSHVFTDEQLTNLTAITWLYRGEQEKFVALLASYQAQLVHHLSQLAERLANDEQQVSALARALRNFAQTAVDDAAIAAVREKLGEDHGLTNELLQAYRAEVHKVDEQAHGWRQALNVVLREASAVLKALAPLSEQSTFDQRKALQDKVDAIGPALKAGSAALEGQHKAWLKLLDFAEKALRARQWTVFDSDAVREAKKALLPRDVKKREKPTVRDLGMEAIKRATYFIAQTHWLLSRFPSGKYEDVSGLCKAVSRNDIKYNDYSLTPGRYVGAAAGMQDDDDGVKFVGRMREIHSELAELNDKAFVLAAAIQAGISELLE